MFDRIGPIEKTIHADLGELRCGVVELKAYRTLALDTDDLCVPASAGDIETTVAARAGKAADLEAHRRC